MTPTLLVAALLGPVAAPPPVHVVEAVVYRGDPLGRAGDGTAEVVGRSVVALVGDEPGAFTAGRAFVGFDFKPGGLGMAFRVAVRTHGGETVADIECEHAPAVSTWDDTIDVSKTTARYCRPVRLGQANSWIVTGNWTFKGNLGADCYWLEYTVHPVATDAARAAAPIRAQLAAREVRKQIQTRERAKAIGRE